MIYNQQNLPLSFKKVFKKSIGSVALLIFLFMFLVAPAIFMGGVILIGELASSGHQDYSWIGVLVALTIPILSFIFIWLIAFAYQYLYYKNYKYTFNDTDAEITKGVISVATGHVVYDKLQNIYVDQDLLDRIFGLYDVHYETAGAMSAFYSHVDGLEKENADKLISFLKERVESAPAKTADKQIAQATRQSAEVSSIENTGISNIVNSTLTSSDVPLSLGTDIVKELIAMAKAGLAMFVFFFIVTILVRGTNLPSGVSLNLNEVAFDVAGWTVIILIIGSLFSFFELYLFYRNFRLDLGREQATITKKVFSTSVSTFYYNRLQDVNVIQTFISRMLDASYISIETAAEGGKQVIGPFSVDNANRIRNFLLDKAKYYHKNL